MEDDHGSRPRDLCNDGEEGEGCSEYLDMVAVEHGHFRLQIAIGGDLAKGDRERNAWHHTKILSRDPKQLGFRGTVTKLVEEPKHGLCWDNGTWVALQRDLKFWSLSQEGAQLAGEKSGGSGG